MCWNYSDTRTDKFRYESSSDAHRTQGHSPFRKRRKTSTASFPVPAVLRVNVCEEEGCVSRGTIWGQPQYFENLLKHVRMTLQTGALCQIEKSSTALKDTIFLWDLQPQQKQHTHTYTGFPMATQLCNVADVHFSGIFWNWWEQRQSYDEFHSSRHVYTQTYTCTYKQTTGPAFLCSPCQHL